MKLKRYNKKRSGFTITELLIVIAIGGIILLMAVALIVAVLVGGHFIHKFW